MPKLDHTGPEGKGTKTGRKLGLCKTKSAEVKHKYGEGMGMKRKVPDCNDLGKRIYSSYIFFIN